MRLTTSVFRSRLAHRILFLFVVCSVLPISILAFISYRQVVSDLKNRAIRHLHQSAKATALSLYGELVSAEDQVASLGRLAALGADPRNAAEALSGHRLTRIEILSRQEAARRLQARVSQEQEIEKVLTHLDQGRSLLFLNRVDGTFQTSLLHALGTIGGSAWFSEATLNPNHLWGADSTTMIPAGVDLCVFDGSLQLVHGSSPVCAQIRRKLLLRPDQGVSGTFNLKASGTGYFVSYRKLFLKARFDSPDWTLTLSQPKSEIFAPAARFSALFPPTVLTAVWLILLANILVLRRVLGPLDVLKEGTGEVARRNFNWRAHITSGDELEELGTAFNAMAARLESQFRTQRMIADLHRAILSSLDASQIVRTAVLGGIRTLDCDLAAVALPLSDGTGQARLFAAWTGSTGVDVDLLDEPVPTLHETLELRATGELDEKARELVKIFDPASELGLLVVAPVTLPAQRNGILCLGWPEDRGPDRLPTEHLRLLADQLEVALANAQLVTEIEELMWGTLEALGRAVDAKSPWTAGHSERVTRIAVAIAREMGLPPATLKVIRSGALLHDVGKIGVEVEILDKPARLTPHEFEVMRSHPVIGERILQPIQRFAELLPMVSQHHEWYNGKGYPRGLKGDEIDLKARILAVADVYEALTTDRPYRSARSDAEAVQAIVDGAGTQFDPEVVEAFLRVVRRQETDSQDKFAHRKQYDSWSEGIPASSALMGEQSGMERPSRKEGGE